MSGFCGPQHNKVALRCDFGTGRGHVGIRYVINRAQQSPSVFDLDQARLPPANGIYGMRHHALILIAWYSWFAVLLGALVYFLVG